GCSGRRSAERARGADRSGPGRSRRTCARLRESLPCRALPSMTAPSPLLRSLALCGVLASAYGAGAWFDFVPGGWRLRARFEEPGAESARRARLHVHERLRSFAAEPPAAARGAVLLLGSSTIE